MSDDTPVEKPVEAVEAATRPPIGVSAGQIFTVALIAIGAWLAVSAWILADHATQAERASILEVAKTIATAAFFFYLGSSASARNREHTP